MPSPDRNSENTPRETPRSAVSGFRNSASVLASAKEEATLREHMIVPDGKGGTRLRDTVYFSILQKEWPDIKQALQRRIAATNDVRLLPGADNKGLV